MNYFETFGINVGKGNHHEETIYSIVLAFNLLNNEMTAYLKEFNLTPAQFNVLMVIRHQGNKDDMSQVEISKKLIVTPSNMTRLLDKLEKEKLVQRVSQSGDRRVKIIQITEKATRFLDAVWPEYNKKLKQLADQIDPNEQEIVSRVLVKLVNKLADFE